jgi:hypothetical protein
MDTIESSPGKTTGVFAGENEVCSHAALIIEYINQKAIKKLKVRIHRLFYYKSVS